MQKEKSDQERTLIKRVGEEVRLLEYLFIGLTQAVKINLRKL